LDIGVLGYIGVRNILPKSGTFLLGHPVYITRLASNEIFLPSNKIHREVGRAKDLSAPLCCSLYKDKKCGRTGDVGETIYYLNITFCNTFYARNRRKS
jgi:hypothetical protein